MHPVEIKSRDGLTLRQLPDPAARRDRRRRRQARQRRCRWCCSSTAARGRATAGASTRAHQWLANRGYAVLSASTSAARPASARTFLNAGNLRVGRQDARRPARRGRLGGRSKASPTADKVAIMGGSYGGYATLVGLTFTPDVFACGVDIVGPSNLETLLETIPPYWAPMVEQFHERMGDPDTPEGKALLERALAAAPGRQDQAAAADRPGRQRPARQAGRGRPDRRRR